MPEPRELSLEEVTGSVTDFAHAAAHAVAAGADGVEIHAASGYLPHQFISSNANQRTDRYGGTPQNRNRFAVEVAAAVANEIGADRTGIRISPANPFNDIVERNTAGTYDDLVRRLADLRLAYLHVVHPGDDDLVRALRAIWPTTLILNRASQAPEQLGTDIAAGLADVMSVGALALANPDLVQRLRTGAPMNQPEPSSFFGGTDKGYTDYPTLTPA